MKLVTIVAVLAAIMTSTAFGAQAKYWEQNSPGFYRCSGVNTVAKCRDANYAVMMTRAQVALLYGGRVVTGCRKFQSPREGGCFHTP